MRLQRCAATTPFRVAKARVLRTAFSVSSSRSAHQLGINADFFLRSVYTSQRRFAIAAPTRVWCAKKRLRGLKKRAGGDAAAAAVTFTAPTAAAAAAPPSAVLAPPAERPEHPSPRNVKEAAEVANARMDHAIKENARSFVALHQQQQNGAGMAQAATPTTPATSLPSTRKTSANAQRAKSSGGNRSRKRRASLGTAPAQTFSASKRTTLQKRDAENSSAEPSTAYSASDAVASASAEEDAAEAAAIAAAVEKVLNAAAASKGTTSHAHSTGSANATQAGSAAVNTASPTPSALSSSGTAPASARQDTHIRPAKAGKLQKGTKRKIKSARAGGAAEATEGHGDTTNMTRAHAARAASSDTATTSAAGTPQSDPVSLARAAIVSGKHKILAAAAAAVVTDAVHARASQTEPRTASVSSFASSLLGNDVPLEPLGRGAQPHASATASTSPGFFSSAALPLPDSSHGTTASASAAGNATLKSRRGGKKGRGAKQNETTPSAPSASSSPLLASSEAKTGLATSAALGAPPPPPVPQRRGRKLSDDAAANATATAIVRRLTAFTGLNREQQAKLKRLLLTRQQRLLRRRRRLLQRTRRAAEVAAAAQSRASGGGGNVPMAPAAMPAPASAKRKVKSSARAATASASTTAKPSAPAAAPVATSPATSASSSPAGVPAQKGTNPLVSPDYREQVLNVFERLAEVNLALGEKYKTQSYVTAVERLKKGDTLFRLLPPHLLPVDESSLHLYGDAEQVQTFLQKRALARTCAHVPGIGDKLKKKITEILTKGGLAELDVLEQKPVIQAIKSLTEVHGVGPRTAVHLYKDFGITNVEELKAYVEAQDKKALASGAGSSGSGAVSKSKKKSKDVFTVTDAQRLGLKYHKDISKRLPHSEGRLHEAFLKLRLKKHFGEANFELVVCGSYRRECPDSGDIDVLITTRRRSGGGSHLTNTTGATQSLAPQDILGAFLDVLREEKYVEATLAQGPTKFMGMCRLRSTKDATRRLPARRLDVRFVDADSFAAALLYFTGSKNFNVVMRAEAIKRNFVLNEYGLFKNQSNNTLATSKLHDAISKLSKAQFYGGQPNDILKQQEKRLQAQQKDGDNTSASTTKQKIYTKAELNELYTMWQAVESLRVKCRTEEDIFKAIGMTYVAPVDRNM